MPKEIGTAKTSARIDGDDGAVDRHRGAEDLLDRVPGGRDQEQRAELAEGGKPAEEQHDDDGAEQHQHERAGEAGERRRIWHRRHARRRRGADVLAWDDEGLLQIPDPDRRFRFT